MRDGSPVELCTRHVALLLRELAEELAERLAFHDDRLASKLYEEFDDDDIPHSLARIRIAALLRASDKERLS